jgi:hypothetical protein
MEPTIRPREFADARYCTCLYAQLIVWMGDVDQGTLHK